MPPVTVLAAVSVSTLDAATVPLRDVAEKFPVTPLGNPAIDSAIVEELKPFTGVVTTVSVTVVAAVMLSDAVVGVSVNVGAGITSEIARVAVCPLPAAVTVNA